MKKYLLILAGLSLLFSGCATSQSHTTTVDGLNSRIHVLENNLERKDREITSLQGHVSDLNQKLVKKDRTIQSLSPKPPSQKTGSTEDHLGVIRLPVSVEDVQTALKNAGVYSGNVDGKVGPNTISAISEFQKSHGLTSDSIVGKQTWEILRDYLN